MKIVFWSIGKANEPYVKQGVEDFTKRINNYFKTDWEIIASPKNGANVSIDDIKKTEGAVVLNKIQQGDFLILLDERGTQITSERLATQIQSYANASAKRIIFLIGGAYGIGDEVKKKADFIWSLSKLVFPHQLVRLILTEQVYRACTILKNEKYHHQ